MYKVQRTARVNASLPTARARVSFNFIHFYASSAKYMASAFPSSVISKTPSWKGFDALKFLVILYAFLANLCSVSCFRYSCRYVAATLTPTSDTTTWIRPFRATTSPWASNSLVARTRSRTNPTGLGTSSRTTRRQTSCLCTTMPKAARAWPK